MLRKGLAAIVLLGLAFQGKAQTAEEIECGPGGRASRIESYEPNTIGWTKDSDDVGFLDFKISVAYRLPTSCNWYFMFTGRFGQYLGTRDSSPVIGKRFNPKLTYRLPTDFGYVDLLSAHESNGQSVDTLAQYNAVAAQQKDPRFADDYVSRGWDYVGVIGKFAMNRAYADAIYWDLKYFLHRGPLQGTWEEYRDWETSPELKGRNRVNGVSVMAKNVWRQCAGTTFCDYKFLLAFETGYIDPFRYNTARVELGTKLRGIPVVLSLANGYAADLAQYFKKTTSVGLAFEVGGF